MKNIYFKTRFAILMLISMQTFGLFSQSKMNMSFKRYNIEFSLGSQFGSVPHQIKHFLYKEDFTYQVWVTDYIFIFPTGYHLETRYASSNHHEYFYESRKTYLQTIDIRPSINFINSSTLSLGIHLGIGTSSGRLSGSLLQVFQSDLAYDSKWYGMKMGFGTSQGFIYLNKDYSIDQAPVKPDRYSKNGTQKFFITPELRFGPRDYAFVKWNMQEDCLPICPLNKIILGSGLGDYSKRGVSAGIDIAYVGRIPKETIGYNLGGFYEFKNKIKLSLNFDYISKMKGYEGVDNKMGTKSEDYPETQVLRTFWMVSIKGSYRL